MYSCRVSIYRYKTVEIIGILSGNPNTIIVRSSIMDKVSENSYGTKNHWIYCMVLC